MKIAVNLKEKRLSEKIVLGQTVVTMMTDNPNFAALAAQVVAFQGITNALDTAVQTHTEARQSEIQKKLAVETAEANFNQAIMALAVAVEDVSNGDVDKILSSGFGLRAPNVPVGPLGAPLSLNAFANGSPGKVTLRWGRVRGARSYEVQSSPDPITPTSWQLATSVTRARVTLTGLPSVTRCWFRVRAIGAVGPGDWSDPAIKTVP